ncbi:MAG: DUF1565 domain-containing protein [Candidatus Coatesbacteria bacterium]|nr:DUF1565 domain-containing protein [Candidatus Coatesbacteria bacterium]
MRMRRDFKLTIAALLLFFAVAVVVAWADQLYYVDVEKGTDANGYGASPGYGAWKSITYALAHVAGSETDPVELLIARGTYDSSIESFPLSMESYVSLYGIHPSSVTIDAGGSSKRALFSDGAVDVTVSGLTIENGDGGAPINEYTRGGAVYCLDSSLEFVYCRILNSSADYGGGIYTNSETHIKFVECEIANNSATIDGGGIYTDHSYVTIWDTVIADNTADNDGGGMFFDNNLSIEIWNCLIIRNKAGVGENPPPYGDGEGGGVYVNGKSTNESEPLFINCTFSLNEAGAFGGAIALGSYAKPRIVNSILWGDKSHKLYDGKYYNEIYNAQNNNSICVTYSDVDQDGYLPSGGQTQGCNLGNIRQDPLFDPYGGYEDFFLSQGSKPKSPCVDTGDNDWEWYGGCHNHKYTTDPSDHLDMSSCTDQDKVDMGYHYKTYGMSYIELALFSVDVDFNRVVLKWETATEIDNAGFLVYRRENEASEYQRVSSFIPAAGAAANGASYSFTDANVKVGETYYYYLVDIDTSGKWTAHGPVPAGLPGRLEFIGPVHSLIVNQRPSAR